MKNKYMPNPNSQGGGGGTERQEGMEEGRKGRKDMAGLGRESNPVRPGASARFFSARNGSRARQSNFSVTIYRLHRLRNQIERRQVPIPAAACRMVLYGLVA